MPSCIVPGIVPEHETEGYLMNRLGRLWAFLANSAALLLECPWCRASWEEAPPGLDMGSFGRFPAGEAVAQGIFQNAS